MQWLGVLGGFGLAIGWGMYVSPFGSYVTLVSAIYLGGIPAAAAFLASVTEFDLWLLVSCAWRWRRSMACYLPGPGEVPHGYIVHADERHQRARRPTAPELDLRTLWDG
jgi:hypothetical protein